MNQPRNLKFIPYHHLSYEPDVMLERASSFRKYLENRRTVRVFSDKPIPAEVIEQIIMAASTAPSGANKQPWTFCAISDPDLKRRIREAAEAEEYESYTRRMSQEWLDDLKPFRTDWHKPFIETVPWLIVVFKRSYELDNGVHRKNYYVTESVGIATGVLLTAIHNAGLVALTHTPSPMGFLAEVLNRPENEKPFMLIPVGYPHEQTTVPDIHRKAAEDVIVWHTDKK